jgi:hypothetical protein
MTDFVRGISSVEGRFRLLGPFPTEATSIDPEAFADEMRTQMKAALAAIRSGSEQEEPHVRPA